VDNRVTLGYWINEDAGWHHIRAFASPRDLVRWLVVNGHTVERITVLVAAGLR
jgi:hypothetical protein